MAALSKTEQQTLINQLDLFGHSIYLVCDGYLVSASLQRVDKNHLGVVVYVNGTVKGEWAVSDVDESLRFLRRRERFMFSHKLRAQAEKRFGKRYCKKYGFYDKQYFYDFVWRSQAAFIRHIAKHNKSIEVIDYPEYKRRIDAIATQPEQESVA